MKYNTVFLELSGSGIFYIVLIGGIILWSAVSKFYETEKSIIRKLKRSNYKRIREVKDNQYVKIKGIAKHVEKPLIAPLSGRKCIFYQIKVEKPGDSDTWHTVIEETKTQDFFVESEGKLAIVQMKDSEPYHQIFLDKDHFKTTVFPGDDMEKLETYLKKHHISSSDLWGKTKTFQFWEGIIELDEAIVVKGNAKWKKIKEPIVGYQESKILTLSGTLRRKLLVTDLKKAIQLKS